MATQGPLNGPEKLDRKVDGALHLPAMELLDGRVQVAYLLATASIEVSPEQAQDHVP